MDGDGFKAPRLPGQSSSGSSSSGSNKRKATEDLNGKGKQRAVAQQPPSVSVTSEDNDEDNDNEEASYNSFAPGNDADYFIEDDNEGRFYGGGLSSTQKQILDIFEGQDGNDDGGENDTEGGSGTKEGENADVMTVQKVRRQLLNLERAINKNAEMRVKWSGQPEKFVESEVTLDSAIQELLLLTQNPREFYPELIKLGIPNSLADLLSHENIDISLAVITALGELTDDDVTEGNIDDGEDSDSEDTASSRSIRAATGSLSSRAAVVSLADSLLSSQLLELATNNLSRLNEEGEEAERSGVYHTLSLVENLLSLKPDLSSSIAKDTGLTAWLLKRLQPSVSVVGKNNGNVKEKGKMVEEDPVMAQNRRYSAELLAIILQGTEVGREARVRFGKDRGIEVCLKVLSAYRKRDPSGADELEYMENIFDSLCSSLSHPNNRSTFLAEEGIELMVIMMKEKMLARNRAIKVLDHALSGTGDGAGEEGGDRFVETGGLKGLFSAFMNKQSKENSKKKSSNQQHALTNEDEEHILSILVALLSNLSSDSIPRIRLLAKFVEDNYSKIDRLIFIRTSLLQRVRKRERELVLEKQAGEEEGLELDEVEEYLERLEGGLASLQMADTVLAWVCMEDDGVRDHARTLLEAKGSNFGEVVEVLQEYQRNIGDAAGSTTIGDGETQVLPGQEEAERQRGILGHLIEYLRGC